MYISKRTRAAFAPDLRLVSIVIQILAHLFKGLVMDRPTLYRPNVLLAFLISKSTFVNKASECSSCVNNIYTKSFRKPKTPCYHERHRSHNMMDSSCNKMKQRRGPPGGCKSLGCAQTTYSVFSPLLFTDIV